MIKCSNRQRRELKTALAWRMPPAQRQRIQMVLLRESGITQAAIAEAMGVSLSTVNRAHMAYDRGGIKALRPKPNGGRKRENMTVAEEKALLSRFAKTAGAGELLNIHDLKAAYEKAIGHATSNSTVYNLLARHGWRNCFGFSKGGDGFPIFGEVADRRGGFGPPPDTANPHGAEFIACIKYVHDGGSSRSTYAPKGVPNIVGSNENIGLIGRYSASPSPFVGPVGVRFSIPCGDRTASSSRTCPSRATSLTISARNCSSVMLSGISGSFGSPASFTADKRACRYKATSRAHRPASTIAVSTAFQSASFPSDSSIRAFR